jgi:hypothetical protein
MNHIGSNLWPNSTTKDGLKKENCRHIGQQNYHISHFEVKGFLEKCDKNFAKKSNENESSTSVTKVKQQRTWSRLCR